MNKVATRVNKVLTSFQEHVSKTHKESTHEVKLPPEKTVAYNVELAEQENFLKFHLDIADGVIVIVNACHCYAALDSRETLRKHNFQFKETPFTCDCGKQFNLPVPLNQNLQEDDVWLPELLTNGVLDYTHQ